MCQPDIAAPAPDPWQMTVTLLSGETGSGRQLWEAGHGAAALLTKAVVKWLAQA